MTRTRQNEDSTQLEWELTKQLIEIQLSFDAKLKKDKRRNKALKKAIEDCQNCLANAIFLDEKRKALEALSTAIKNYNPPRKINWHNNETHTNFLYELQKINKISEVILKTIPKNIDPSFIQRRVLSENEIARKYGCKLIPIRNANPIDPDPNVIMGQAKNIEPLQTMTGSFPIHSLKESKAKLFQNIEPIKTTTSFNNECVKVAIASPETLEENDAPDKYFLFAMHEVEKMRDLARFKGLDPDNEPITFYGVIPKPIQDAIIIYCHRMHYLCEAPPERAEEHQLLTEVSKIQAPVSKSDESYAQFIVRQLNDDSDNESSKEFVEIIKLIQPRMPPADKGEVGRILNSWNTLKNDKVTSFQKSIDEKIDQWFDKADKFIKLDKHGKALKDDNEIVIVSDEGKAELESITEEIVFHALDELFTPDFTLDKNLMDKLIELNDQLENDELATMFILGALSSTAANIFAPQRDFIEQLELLEPRRPEIGSPRDIAGTNLKILYERLNNDEHFKYILINRWLKNRRDHHPEFYRLFDTVKECHLADPDNKPLQDLFSCLNCSGDDYNQKLRNFAVKLEKLMMAQNIHIDNHYSIHDNFDNFMNAPELSEQKSLIP